MKRPYSSPKLTKYTLSSAPDHVLEAIAGMDNKIYIPPNGSMHGLQCAICGRTFYASTAKQVNDAFDKHDCEQSAKQK